MFVNKVFKELAFMFQFYHVFPFFVYQHICKETKKFEIILLVHRAMRFTLVNTNVSMKTYYGNLFQTDGKLFQTDGNLFQTDGNLFQTDGKLFQTDGNLFYTDENLNNGSLYFSRLFSNYSVRLIEFSDADWCWRGGGK